MSWKTDFNRFQTGQIILSAGLYSLSFPPSPFGFLIYIALIPQINLYRTAGVKKGFLYGYSIGLIINALVLYWIIPYSLSSYLWMILANALPFAIFGCIFSFISEKNSLVALISFPFVWTFIEYIRQIGDLAFNWLSIAYTQSSFLSLIQYAEITGYLGIVFWICMINLLGFMVWKNWSNIRIRVYSLIIIVVLFILPLIFGYNRLSEKEETLGLAIGYVQPNINPWLKWKASYRYKNLEKLTQLTNRLLNTESQLVVWPETALPFPLIQNRNIRESISKYISDRGIHLITGALDSGMVHSTSYKYNVAVHFAPGRGAQNMYRKLSLVPFVERIPYQDIFTSLLGFDINDRFLSAGDSTTVFNILIKPYQLQFDGSDWSVVKKISDKRLVRFSSIICFESMFPNLVRKFFVKGAELLIIITNDGWFGYSAQPFQHARLAVFRAIEQRSSVIQCANNGVSVFIDPYGRMFYCSKIFTTGCTQKIMPLKLRRTFYERYGDILGILCSIVCFALVLWCVYYYRTQGVVH